MKKIVLTGGGTAGHVTPNIALLPRLQELGYEVSYIGSRDGIEKKLIGDCHIPYYEVSTGKLRRYFDLKNFTDPFRVIKGLFDADKKLDIEILSKEDRDVLATALAPEPEEKEESFTDLLDQLTRRIMNEGKKDVQ